MTLTDDVRRREAQRLLLAEILREQAQVQAQAEAQTREAIEAQRLLNAASQRPATTAQPLTDPAQRRAAQQRAIAQTLGPRPQAQPQAQPQGMNLQSREFFEAQRLLNAGSVRRAEAQRVLNAQYDPSADDRIARKLNAIVKRSDVEVSQNGYTIEIRRRGRMRDEIIRAMSGPVTTSTTTARYR